MIWSIVKSKITRYLFGSFLLVGFILGAVNFAYGRHPKYDVPIYGGDNVSVIQEKEAVKHLETPTPLKAIYMTSCVVSTPSFRDKLVALVDETEINAIIIDIKDFTGTLSYKPKDESLIHLWEIARCGTADMKEFVAMLHDKNIYVIGRVTVFQDPQLTKTDPSVAVKFKSTGGVWKDRKGLSFSDPGSKKVWDYHIAIARDAYELGFDEINFDYIRFPSDGPMADIYFPESLNRPKPEVLESFFSYLNENLKSTGMIISADLFGMTTTNTDDLNIGQVLEVALLYFDYIAPMVYPSHYPNNFNGWADPNEVPYELIKFVMDSAVKRTVATSTVVATKNAKLIATTTPPLYHKEVFSKSKIRPWLQDFDYPVPYSAEDVRAQIKGVYDAGLDSWMLWDPANIYTREALQSN